MNFILYLTLPSQSSRLGIKIRAGPQEIKKMDEQEYIKQKYKAGALKSIEEHLDEFIDRCKPEIEEIIQDSKGEIDFIDAIKKIVQKKGSIHLPSEMADQIKEINNEIWYRGEKGDHDRAHIQEEWAMKYAADWRSYRIKEIIYVIELHREQIISKYS